MAYTLMIGLLVSLIPLSLLARPSNRAAGLHLAKRLTIPMGMVATILQLVQILPFLFEQSKFLQASANALFLCLVTCTQYTILHQIDAPSKSVNIVRTSTRISIFGLLAVILAYILYLESFMFLVDLKTLCTFGIGIGLLGLMQRRFSSTEGIGFGHLAIPVALINALHHSSQLFQEDPSTIGPHIASIYIGLLLGFITLMIWEIQQPFTQSQSTSKAIVSPSIILGTYALCFGPLWMMSLNLQLSYLDAQTTQISHSDTTQQALLQKLVLHDATTRSNHLTISSDKPSWIFIDDKLIGASPIYQEYLEPGDYTIKIASCPTHLLMMPENNIARKSTTPQSRFQLFSDVLQATLTSAIELVLILQNRTPFSSTRVLRNVHVRNRHFFILLYGPQRSDLHGAVRCVVCNCCIAMALFTDRLIRQFAGFETSKFQRQIIFK